MAYSLRKQELGFHGRYSHTKLIGLYEGSINIFGTLYNINYLYVNKNNLKNFIK